MSNLGGAAKGSAAEDSADAPEQPKEEELKEPSAVVAEPSPRLLADTTPESEQLDLSSAEVDTVTNITTADEKDGKESVDAQEEAPAGTEAAKGGPEGAEAAASAEGTEQRAEEPSEAATTTSKEGDEAASAAGKPAAESMLSEQTAEEPKEEAPAKSEKADLAEPAAEHPAAEPASSEQQVPGAQKSQEQAGDAVKELSPGPASASQQDMAQPQSREVAGTGGDAPVLKPPSGKESAEAQADEHTRPEAAVSANAAAGSKLNGAVEHSGGTAASKSPTDRAERPAGQPPVTTSEAAGDALEAVALPGKAPFDPLGMGAAEEGLPAPEVCPHSPSPPL